jgi:choline dehydrogenase-like flavoprotein
VLFEGCRAIGVRFRRKDVTREARAQGEVILAAGAVGSPQLLLLSGIGPGPHLKDKGLAVVLDKPGVGENLHDHLQIPMRYTMDGIGTFNERFHSPVQLALMALKFLFLRRGPLTMAPAQIGIFTRSDAGQPLANIGINVLPYTRSSVSERSLDRKPGITVSVYDLRPTSRGHVRLKLADPMVHPEIRFNYLSTERDRKVAADAMHAVRRIMAQPSLRKYRPVELSPGEDTDDSYEALLKSAGKIASTIFHPVGSCKMGLSSDPLAVVDHRLRVIGLGGLRVSDASIMPAITSGNTNAPTMMIAEKGAAMVLEDAR